VDFIDQLRVLASRISTTKDLVQTEEATKNSMVMPFIQALGYDPFNPLEVTPELVADIGTKKGEKVDYAILRDGKPIMLIECKKSGGDLSINHAGQLFRYFHVTAARFGVLTNGLVYRFFTDLEHPNKMDEKPFFEFNILDFRERDVEELKKFAKAAFDLETILTTANELKYTRAIQNKLATWIENPPEEAVRLLAGDLIGNRKFTATIREQFTPITRRAFEQLIGERINTRLKGAMSPEAVSVVSLQTPTGPAPLAAADEAKPPSQSDAQTQLETSLEELEAFHLVRAILRDVVSPKRIFIRDAQSYCAVLLDDNNRKPICRLRFNNTQKLRLGLFNANKDEEVMSMDSVDDVFRYAEQLKGAALLHLTQQ
jgi:hypothetical protein